MVKENINEPSKPVKIMVALGAFIIFGFIGGVVRLFTGPINLTTNIYEFMLQFAPFIIGFGGISAFLAYLYPRLFGFILSFLSMFSIGN